MKQYLQGSHVSATPLPPLFINYYITTIKYFIKHISYLNVNAHIDDFDTWFYKNVDLHNYIFTIKDKLDIFWWNQTLQD